VPFSVKNDRADELLDRMRRHTGEGITQAVVTALEERLERLERGRPSRRDAIDRCLERIRTHRIVDQRSNDEIIGYDEHGLPT
jgi:antitoxin VapB